jgi:6-pyruvoyltetrahydropterin/6-carboxytetrahydropterin synthase
MTEIMYRHEVPFGHRLMRHDGKCRYPHGHNYLFEIVLQGPVDKETGMVVDFSILKEFVRGFFTPFDHAFVIQQSDPLLFLLRAMAQIPQERDGVKLDVVPTKCVVLNDHPTAENLASLVSTAVSSYFDDRPVIVTCWEQRDAYARSTEDRRVRIVEKW